jgi:hypothetical protein
MSSFTYFGRSELDAEVISNSEVPRFMFKAIAEGMITENGDNIIGFSEFTTRYTNEPQYQRFFEELSRFLSGIQPTARPLEWDRLIAAGANLWALIRLLDPRSELVQRRPLANVERMIDGDVRDHLLREVDV